MITGLRASALQVTVYYWLHTDDTEISTGLIKTRAIDQVISRLRKEGFYLPGDVIELKTKGNGQLETA